MKVECFVCRTPLLANRSDCVGVARACKQSDQLSFNYAGRHTVTVRTSDESELLIDDTVLNIDGPGKNVMLVLLDLSRCSAISAFGANQTDSS
jgi:hypothetical protein